MENKVCIFENEQFGKVRTVMIDGEPWFVLTDVCRVLEIQNATDVAKRLDEDEVTRFNLGGLSGEANIVNESGLYNTIFRSDKPVAKSFKRWITHDVIPAIRKTGVYSTRLSINRDAALMNSITRRIQQYRILMAKQGINEVTIAGDVKNLLIEYGTEPIPEHLVSDKPQYEQMSFADFADQD